MVTHFGKKTQGFLFPVCISPPMFDRRVVESAAKGVPHGPQKAQREKRRCAWLSCTAPSDSAIGNAIVGHQAHQCMMSRRGQMLSRATPKIRLRDGSTHSPWRTRKLNCRIYNKKTLQENTSFHAHGLRWEGARRSYVC